MQQNPFLYPGRGVKLRRVTAATGNTIYAPETTTIPAGGRTELIGAHDCLELLLEAVFAAAATGTVVVEKVADQDASAYNAYTSDTVTAAASYNWNAGEPLVGFFRVYNNTDQAAVVTCQKRIN